MMDINEGIVVYIGKTYYEISVIPQSVFWLYGYSDRNVSFVDSNDGKKYVLKIVQHSESQEDLTDIIDEVVNSIYEYGNGNSTVMFTSPRLVRTSSGKLSSRLNIRHKLAIKNGSQMDEFEERICQIRLVEFFEGIPILDYINYHQNFDHEHSKSQNLETLYRNLGKMCQQIFQFFRSQHHLLDKLKLVRNKYEFGWQLATCCSRVSRLAERFYPDKSHQRRACIDRTLREFESIQEEYGRLTEFVLHGDLNGRNILINLASGEPRKLCLIDFQDLQVGPQIVELAIMIMYCVVEQQRIEFRKALLLIPGWILAGYQAASAHSTSSPISRAQIGLIPTLMKLRLCQSVLGSQEAHQLDPGNKCVLATTARAWQLLELMNSLEEASKFSDSKRLAGLWLKTID